ncbi:heat shock protein 75 kDa, mitochondrial [Planococcus citri]|uniref:heat shock protein 75 kDa, mitochondrial n=1 Tax=Planococcus citri TaxID=170843 RepID=UPI0031F787A8
MASLISRRIILNYARQQMKISYYFKFRNADSLLFRKKPNNVLSTGFQRFSSTQTQENVPEEQSKSTASKAEEAIGEAEKREFQAETRMLLDIVAKSLYSDKEVFVRELVSNASDALEKLRYISLTENPNQNIGALEIRLSTDKHNRLLTIQDTGIGMTKEELISNLGTIARSGSKAFLEELKNKSGDTSSIIGQFGVGFYSCFMVANKVEVFTKSAKTDGKGYYWTSDGSGSYEIRDAEGVERGTKIVLHLKADCREFADESRVQNVIQKYSNFVNCPVYINENKANTIQPLWLMDPKSISNEQHNEFYRFISNSVDKPRFVMHYSTDAPLTIRALFYFPSTKPPVYEINQECGVALYTKRVLIKSKAEEILPKWCRFIKGVVDSEDISLNLSRELLQNSPMIAKIRNILTTRIIKFLLEKSNKEPEEYAKFYADHHIFLKSGIVFADMHETREEVAKLLRYETSVTNPGEMISLTDYIKRMQNDQKEIFYVNAPSRSLAETSPYLEDLKKKNVEVLFCYETYDEQVLLQLRSFKNKTITSAEKQLREDKDDNIISNDKEENPLRQTEIDNLLKWAQDQLQNKAAKVKITNKLDSHPCVVTVEEMAAARHIIKTQAHQFSEDMMYTLLQPRLELNPKHPIVKKLSSLVSSNPELASLLIKQLFTNAMSNAGLIDDPRLLLTDMNKLLSLALEKH